MILGFTGTRHPLPTVQQAALAQLLGTIEHRTPISAAHHGDCVGADAVFDTLCWGLGIERHAHPGASRNGDSPGRAYCEADVIHEPRWYLDRNGDIVEACQVLIACPGGTETVRSGTWATIRRARKQSVQVIIVWPDGRVERD